MISPGIENELRSLLVPGEKFIWTGSPRTGIVFRSSDVYLIPFSLIWLGFAVFWESMAIRNNTPVFFKLWGISFILVGLYMAAGRFFMDARKRARTLYALTPQRIIIRTGIFGYSVSSYNLQMLPAVTYTEKQDQSGTIQLEQANARGAAMPGMEWPGMKQLPRLEMIEEVKTVYDKIMEFQRKQA